MTTEEPSFVHGASAVTRRNLLVWYRYAAASVLGNFGEPILYLLALGFGLGRVVPKLGGMSYAEFIAPGLVVTTVMYTATFEGTFGSYTRLTSQKTFDAVLATPVTVGELTAGELVWGGIKATVGAVIVLIVIRGFGLVPSWLALAVVPLSFVSGVMFTALALCVATLSKSYEFFNYYFTLVVAPMFLFSGVFFPLDQMPGWVHALAQFMPLTHVVELSRACVRGTLSTAALGHSAALLAILAASVVSAAAMMRRRLRF